MNWLDILNEKSTHVICESQSRNYSLNDFRQRVISLQAFFDNSGINTWVLAEDSAYEFLCAMFALLFSGKDVWIPPNRQSDTIASMLQPGRGLISSANKFSNLRTQLPIAKTPPQSDTLAFTRIAKQGQLSFWTSGSTDKPTRINKTPEQLLLEVQTFREQWPTQPNTLFFPLVSHFHIYGLTFAYLFPLLAKAAFYQPRNKGLLAIVEPIRAALLHQYQHLIVIANPTIGRQFKQIQTLAEPNSLASPDKTSPIVRVLSAGGKLSQAHADNIHSLFNCSVTEVFGSTETGAVAWRARDGEENNEWTLFQNINAVSTIASSVQTKGEDKQCDFAVWGGHVGASRQAPVRTGDLVHFTSPHTFHLIGRNNRVCKIEGKRVSLDAVVNWLEDTEWVEEAIILPDENRGKEVLLCGVILSEQGLSSYRGEGKNATDLKIKNALLKNLEPVLVPRTIRYLDSLPRTDIGKIAQKDVHDLLKLADRPTQPIVQNVDSIENGVVLSLLIPAELRYFKGHFNEQPIVPGIMLVHWIYCFASEHLNTTLKSGSINRLKFSNTIAPCYTVQLTLTLTPKGIEFRYSADANIRYASGQIPFG